MKKEPARKRIAVLRVCSEHYTLETALWFKSRTSLEHDYRLARHAKKSRMIQIAKLHAQQRTGAEELIVLEIRKHVGNRQAERFDRHLRRVVKRNQSSSAPDKFSQRLCAWFTKAADVLARNRAGG